MLSPVLPRWPSAPVLPVAPVYPVAPVLPVAPVYPVAPVAPVAPVSPFCAAAPDMPVSPVAPVGPGAPAGPGTATTVWAGVTTTGLSQAVDSRTGIARNRIEALIGICLSTVEGRRYSCAAARSVRYRAKPAQCAVSDGRWSREPAS